MNSTKKLKQILRNGGVKEEYVSYTLASILRIVYDAKTIEYEGKTYHLTDFDREDQQSRFL